MYELHVTVKTNDVAKFKQYCLANNIKPIVLDLQNKKGKTIMHDVMTSSKCLDNPFLELANICNLLKTEFEVVRTKIESHPNLISQHLNNSKQYLESHLRVVLDKDQLNNLRTNLQNSNIHIARNIFKQLSNNKVQVLLTLRDYEINLDRFNKRIKQYRNSLLRMGYILDKIEIEFVVFDSNFNHDRSWFLS